MSVFIVIFLSMAVLALVYVFKFHWKARRVSALKSYASENGFEVVRGAVASVDSFRGLSSFSSVRVPVVIKKGDVVVFDGSVLLHAGRFSIELRQTVFAVEVASGVGDDVLFVVKSTADRYINKEQLIFCYSEEIDSGVDVFVGNEESCKIIHFDEIKALCKDNKINVGIADNCVFFYRQGKLAAEEEIYMNLQLLDKLMQKIYALSRDPPLSG